LSHAHAEFEPKSEFLIQVVHTTMGLLAVIVAIGRWLELRLGTQNGSREGRVAGVISVMALFLIGIIMMFYREPLMGGGGGKSTQSSAPTGDVGTRLGSDYT